MYIDIFVDIGTHIPMHRRTNTHPYILVHILAEFLSSKKSFLKNISPNTPRIKHLLSLIDLLLLRQVRLGSEELIIYFCFGSSLVLSIWGIEVSIILAGSI
jgi:hypothetical protein